MPGPQKRGICHKMQPHTIERINALARKARETGLTEAEQKEQALLRREYIDAMKQSLRTQLEEVRIVEEDGSETPLKKRG